MNPALASSSGDLFAEIGHALKDAKRDSSDKYLLLSIDFTLVTNGSREI